MPLAARLCGVGVCAGARVLGCTPPILAGVSGCVCACVRAPLVPRHSWLEHAAWVFVLGLGSRLRPATPGWGVGKCVCLCARSACAPPLLAGVCPVGVCVWARVVAAPRHFWLGCWGVRVCVRAPLVPRHSWLGCAVWVCVLRLGFWLPPATPGWGVGVCVSLCAHPLVPRRSWLGCAVWVCVLWLGFRLRPVTPGWGVGVCVCLCAHSACTPPLLAGVLGCVCACVRAPLVPRHSLQPCLGRGARWGRVPERNQKIGKTRGKRFRNS